MVHTSPSFAHPVKRRLSTITSPVFAEIVVVFSAREVHYPPRVVASILREMYEIKEFKVAFCLEAPEELRTSKSHCLALEIRDAVVAGAYDFLPCPPVVFSRTVTRYDCSMSSVEVPHGSLVM